jgi:hypothetical protein
VGIVNAYPRQGTAPSARPLCVISTGSSLGPPTLTLIPLIAPSSSHAIVLTHTKPLPEQRIQHPHPPLFTRHPGHFKRSPGHVRLNQPGADRVDPDIATGKLVRGGLGQGDDRSFRGGVRYGPGIGFEAGDCTC